MSKRISKPNEMHLDYEPKDVKMPQNHQTFIAETRKNESWKDKVCNKSQRNEKSGN